MRDFVLILMTSRSGSSLVSRIFAAHGWDTGGERSYSCGYETFENVAVKRWIDKHKKDLPLVTGQPCPFIPGIEKVIPHNRPVVKIGVEYVTLFERLNPHVVTVKRKPDAVARSVAQKRGRPEKAPNNLPGILVRYQALDRERKRFNGAEIRSDELIKGDMSSARAAFEHFGWKFDEELARSCVEPDKWHTWESIR